jgi:PAS domain S-box-containing protein
VPFVFVCEQLDHHHAIESLSGGVTDFVLKQHLLQLVPVIRRAVHASQTRSELREARANLQIQAELLDLANDSIILCDADGTIRYWNCGSQRIYGWTKEEAVGENVDQLLQTQFADPNTDIEATLRAQPFWEGELIQVRRDGARIHVVSHWTLKGDTTASSRLQINTDITGQKEAEEALRRSEARYRRFVDQDLTGNVIMRPDGSIVTCNPSFVHSFGFASVDDALGANFFTLLRNRKDAAELFAEVKQSGCRRAERAGDAATRRRSGLRRGTPGRHVRRTRRAERGARLPLQRHEAETARATTRAGAEDGRPRHARRRHRPRLQ